MSLPFAWPALARTGRRMRAEAVLRYTVTLACAGSAGVHAALVQPHLAEAGLPLGGAFAVAAGALAAAAIAARQPRHDPWSLLLATGVLTVIAASYLLSRTTGVPLLITHPEPFDPLGAVTTAVELTGALTGASLISVHALTSRARPLPGKDGA
jgi:peptidoglycan/LPS O-acetylase OafA/YrhL